MRTPALHSGFLCLVCAAMALAATAAAAACPAPGRWLSPGVGERDVDALFSELAQSKVVLLGEEHARREHQRWQLHTLAGLHARRPDLVIALEMLPRRAQPALDAWVAGELDEESFLAQSDWRAAWGHDHESYLPILHFARMHRVPLRAVNVDRELHARLASEGWAAVPEEARYGTTAPAEPPGDYRSRLRAVYAEHLGASRAGFDLERFIAGQLVWDRVMAAGVAEAASQGVLVAGLMGGMHLAYGHGVPHQLADLGVTDVRVLLPWDGDGDCSEPPRDIAHAVFGIAPGGRHEPAPPVLLGVLLEPHEDGVRIVDVQAGSVGERSGLRADDVVSHAAGQRLRATDELVAVVRRQAPGTILPLSVRREGREIEVLARFPAHSD